MANLLVCLNGHDTKQVPAKHSSEVRQQLVELATFLRSAAAGNKTLTSVECRGTAVAATGTLTMATSSGTVGGVINGVTVTVEWATSDEVSTIALAAAINASADPLVSNHVTASASAKVTTLTAKNKGHAGNAITLAASGTNVTASAARLASGSNDAVVTYTL